MPNWTWGCEVLHPAVGSQKCGSGAQERSWWWRYRSGRCHGLNRVPPKDRAMVTANVNLFVSCVFVNVIDSDILKGDYPGRRMGSKFNDCCQNKRKERETWDTERIQRERHVTVEEGIRWVSLQVQDHQSLQTLGEQHGPAAPSEPPMAPWSWISDHQSCERVNFCYLKPLSL